MLHLLFFPWSDCAPTLPLPARSVGGRWYRPTIARAATCDLYSFSALSVASVEYQVSKEASKGEKGLGTIAVLEGATERVQQTCGRLVVV